ncbi:MAG: FKBP-type peptidyl-prolyl cis-trans isomerase [Bacteroidota bacterium]
MRVLLFLIIVGSLLTFSGCLDNRDDVFDSNDQLIEDLMVIDEFLADNDINAQTHITGFRYVVENQGSGRLAAGFDTVLIDMSFDRLTDGERVLEFNDDLLIVREQALAAVRFGLRLVEEGGSVTMYVPSGLAFGSQPQEPLDLPANANLIIDLDIKSVINAQRTIDDEIIDDFLESNDSIGQVLRHPSGLRYLLNESSSGTRPVVTDNVVVTYEGRLLNGTVFDEGEEVALPLLGVIEGWQIGLGLNGVGGKSTLFIPSNLAYGPNGLFGSIIGPDEILIFDIELVRIVE